MRWVSFRAPSIPDEVPAGLKAQSDGRVGCNQNEQDASKKVEELSSGEVVRMPIYEFRCEKCGSPFDELVSSASAVSMVRCPKCGSEKVKKQISLFGTSGGGKSAPATYSACTTST